MIQKESPRPTDKTASNTYRAAAMSESPALSGEARGQEIVKEFWPQWTAMRARLYRCCLKLMSFNPMDAEEALSQAMLKAWDMVHKHAAEIKNFKAWLMRLTRNYCLDLVHKRSRRAVGVEDIEWVGDAGELGLGSSVELPEMVLEKEERAREIRRAVDSLPEKMRDTFILHYYSDLSHNEIVEKQGISYDCVCKRLSQARKKLKQMLSGYFIMSQVGEGKISQSRPKKEERPLRRSPEVLKGHKRATERAETEEKPEMVDVPVESREPVEVKKQDAATVSAEVDVDVAEGSESVEVVGEEISDVAGVCCQNEFRQVLPGVLSPTTMELTWRRDVTSFAPLSEWGREMLAACLIGEVRDLTKNTVPMVGWVQCNETQHIGILLNYKSLMDPENSVGHKGTVGNWWRLSGGKFSSILEIVGVVKRKFFNVPDCSKSLSRFQVKKNLEGEQRRWVMGSLLVEMVGAIALKPPRPGVRDNLNRDRAELHLLNARNFVGCGSFVFDTG